MALSPSVFREYDIRGVADVDFSDEHLAGLSRAIGTFLVAKASKKRVAIGCDCRVSSPRIVRALSEGLQKTGLQVVDVGQVPTPLLYFSVFELDTDAGIMVTGSHNPPEYNGFKIALGSGTIHGSEIQEIRQILEEKKLTQGTGSSTTVSDIVSRYLTKVVANIQHPLKLKVVVDSGNGMGGLVAPELYRRLGCEVVELFSEPDGTFPNHHPDPTVAKNLQHLVAAVKKGADIGIGFDGDADRIGAVDPSGRILFGDELLALYARQVLRNKPGATVISDVKASHRLFDDIAKHGGRPILWKTGHSLIKAKMKEEKALLAGEMSGHIFFKDRYYGFDDAIYAGARLLEILAESRKTPAQMLADLPPSFSTAELRVDCPDSVKFEVVEASRKEFEKLGLKVNPIDGARVEFGDGWGLVRASNTQPVLVYRFEANSLQRLEEIRNQIESVVRSKLPGATTQNRGH